MGVSICISTLPRQHTMFIALDKQTVDGLTQTDSNTNRQRFI